jgi:2-oxoglutarate ferredoxin oxidoreductase subunit delta
MAAEKTARVNGSVVVAVERCKGCGFCVEFCPTKALKLSDQYNAKGYHPPMLISQDLCSGCNMCGLLCPDFAIYGFVRKKRTTRGAEA